MLLQREQEKNHTLHTNKTDVLNKHTDLTKNLASQQALVKEIKRAVQIQGIESKQLTERKDELEIKLLAKKMDLQEAEEESRNKKVILQSGETLQLKCDLSKVKSNIKHTEVDLKYQRSKVDKLSRKVERQNEKRVEKQEKLKELKGLAKHLAQMLKEVSNYD